MSGMYNPKHPVTKGVPDFEIFDETYKGYYVEDGVTSFAYN